MNDQRSVEYEIDALKEANLINLIPTYVYDYFKDDFNERILPQCINSLDNLLQTIDASNSFLILSLNNNNNNNNTNCINNNNKSLNPNQELNKSLSFLEIAARLENVFSKYEIELIYYIDLFARMDLLIQSNDNNAADNSNRITTKSHLITFQRAILVKTLANRHFDLFNSLFRHIFELYQKLNKPIESDDEEEDEEEEDEDEDDQEEEEDKDRDFINEYKSDNTKALTIKQKGNKKEKAFSLLIDKFHRINKIL
jgi:hypothetical protein